MRFLPTPEKTYPQISIPVVVHIIYNGSVTGSNINDAQVNSQIDQLNYDFSHADVVHGYAGDPDPYQTVVGVDSKIHFQLASVDPNGNSTAGITRTQSTVTNFGSGFSEIDPYQGEAMKFSAQGGHDAWDPRRYLNIWVCNLLAEGSSTGYAGFTSFNGGYRPGEAADQVDGVVVDYSFFGTTGYLEGSGYHHGGHTTTHEVGHWLYLDHPWGRDDASINCTGDDHVSDTPPCNRPFHSLNGEINHAYECGGHRRLIETFMDYSSDYVAKFFTQKQTERMRKFLLAYRPGFYGHQVTVNSSYGGGTFYAGYTAQGYTLESFTVPYGRTVFIPLGSTITLRATDNQLYPPAPVSPQYPRVFQKWISTFTADQPTTLQTSITPTTDGIYTAIFNKKFALTIQSGQGFDAGSGGSYTINGITTATYNGSFVQNQDNSVLLHFNPPTNTFFAAWSDGNTDNPRTLTPTDNLTLFARFKYAMKSSLSSATVNSSQRKIVVFGATSHAVYPSAGCIWYTQNTGSGWSNEKAITLSGIAKNPSIAVTYPGGNVFLHVVWEEVDPDDYREVYYRRSTDYGQTWGPAVQLNDNNSQTLYTRGNDANPSAAGGTLPVVVVWRCNAGLIAMPEPTDTNSYSQLLSGTNGTSQSPTLDGQSGCRIAYVHGSSGAIYYNEIGTQPAYPYITGFGTPVCISGSTTGCANPTISTVTTSGTPVLTAYDAPSGNIRHLFFAERNSGGTWQNPVEISVDAYNSLSKPSIGVEANITILYENQKTINPTRTFIGKIYRAISCGSWTPVFDLGDGVNPQLAQFANGGAAMRSLWMNASGSAPYAITAKSYQTPMATELNTPGDSATGIGLSPMLTWTAIQTADIYTLELAKNSSFTQNDTLIQSVVSYKQLSGLAVNTTYYWRVRSENNAGYSDWTSAYTFTTMSANITLSSSVVNSHPVLTWAGAISGTPVSLMKRQCPYPSGTCGDPLTIYYGTAATFTDYSCTVVNKLLASANNYYWVVQGTASSNAVSHYDATMMEDKTVVDIPKVTELKGNYPNPFNPSTEIAFDIAAPGYVSLVVYNTLGQEIVRLADGYRDAGRFAASWNAANLPSGMYVARLTVSDNSRGSVYSAVKKLLLAK